MIKEKRFMEIVKEVFNKVHVDNVGRIVTTRAEIIDMFRDEIKNEKERKLTT